MKTNDQQAWLEELNKARGMGFYVYRMAELWANAVEYYLDKREKKRQPPLTPSKIAETVAEAHFWAEDKVLKEMHKKHTGLNHIPPPDATKVLEVLKRHWAHADLLKGWKRT